jgi:hypothetical protein
MSIFYEFCRSFDYHSPRLACLNPVGSWTRLFYSFRADYALPSLPLLFLAATIFLHLKCYF